jgi:hypothetical protein
MTRSSASVAMMASGECSTIAPSSPAVSRRASSARRRAEMSR